MSMARPGGLDCKGEGNPFSRSLTRVRLQRENAPLVAPHTRTVTQVTVYFDFSAIAFFLPTSTSTYSHTIFHSSILVQCSTLFRLHIFGPLPLPPSHPSESCQDVRLQARYVLTKISQYETSQPDSLTHLQMDAKNAYNSIRSQRVSPAFAMAWTALTSILRPSQSRSSLVSTRV